LGRGGGRVRAEVPRLGRGFRTAEPVSLRRAWALGVLALVGLATAGIRLRLLDIPIDRDEGEYAYFAQLLLQGIPPYAQAYNFKMPGIYAVYAVILALFGQTPTAIHLGLLIVDAVTIVLVFFVADRVFGPTVAALAEILPTSYLTVALSAFGFSAFFWARATRARALFVTLFAGAALLATSAGLYFRNQYFILLLPVLAILAGVGVDSVARRLSSV